MPEDTMFQEAIEAIHQGQRRRARDLLTRLLRADPKNTEYWLWMSSVVETPKEQIYCLQTILKIDPKHKAARKGMVLLGGMPPDPNFKPRPIVRRRWQVQLQEVKDVNVLQALWDNPFFRGAALATVALAVIFLIGLGIYYQGAKRKPVTAILITRTPGPSPTYTYTPTAINETPRAPTGIAAVSGPPPLEARLLATYTPTPVYINTPHISNEAYRFAQMAFQRGDTVAAIAYLRQAQQISPDAADIHYLLGEIYRQGGDYKQALEAYQSARLANTNFAPAYLGAARVKRSQNPDADISVELRQALQLDPNLKEAYLELADYLTVQDDAKAALELLDQAGSVLADSPAALLRRAEAELSLGEDAAAYADALKANQMDQTSLDSYRLLALAAARTGHNDQALEAVQVYLTYEQEDPQAWLIQGMGLYALGEYEGALQALDKALELDKNLPEAMQYHGLTLAALGQGQKAVNEIYVALQSDPRSFDLNLAFSRALLSSGRLSDALGQVSRAYDLAKEDAQLAQALFWRAQIYEAIGNFPSAGRDWKKLVELPTSSAIEELVGTAQSHLTATSTPVPSATRTPTPTRTPTVTRTPTPTRTPPPTRMIGTTTLPPVTVTPASPATGMLSPTPTPK